MKDWCELRLDGCQGRATDRHHRQMRSQGGKNDSANILETCHHCHMEVHRLPSIGYEHGWLVRSWLDPAKVPVRRWVPREDVA